MIFTFTPFSFMATRGEENSTADEFTLRFYGDEYAIEKYNGTAETVVIPSEHNGIPIIRIDRLAFYSNKTIKNVYLPDSVSLLYSDTFGNCTALESVYIPASIEYMYGNPFELCPNLSKIHVEESNPVFYVEGNCLINKTTNTLVTGCTDSVIPDGVEIIGEGAFGGSHIERVNIPDSVTTIGEYAFCGCEKLTEISLKSSVKHIGKYAFSGTALMQVFISGAVESIDSYAFSSFNELNIYTDAPSIPEGWPGV